MPTFYFDVCEDGVVAIDEDGVELPDLAAAEREAGDAASTIAHDKFAEGGQTIVVDVRDESGRRVLSVAASLSIVRPDEDRRPSRLN
jgi:hypothetical protein